MTTTRHKTRMPKTDRIRALVVHHTAKTFEISETYVRQIVRGGIDQEEIKSFYNRKYKKVENALNA